MKFISLIVVSFFGLVSSQGPVDLVCGGTSYHEETLEAGGTVELGLVPAGLYWFAVHLWSDEDLDIQIVALEGDQVVVHFEEGLVKDEHEVTTTYKGDTFTYSGHGGIVSSGSRGFENIIFQNVTQNAYKIMAYAREDGHARVRYGWLPTDSCDIMKSRYGHVDMDRMLRNRRLGSQTQYHRGLATANVLYPGNYDIIHSWVEGHTELSYSACWNAIRNTDQNPCEYIYVC